MSQIDIAPTLLGLLNVNYYSKFLGRDILNSAPSGDRAFVGNYQTVGYIRDGRMVLLRPKRSVEVLSMGPGMEVLGPVKDTKLEHEAIAFYEFASFAFSHGLLADEEQMSLEQRVAQHARSGLKP
jgi:hypothetical protein